METELIQWGGGGAIACTILALVFRFLKKRNNRNFECLAGATAQETRALIHQLVNSSKQTNSAVDRLANSVATLGEHVQTHVITQAGQNSAINTKLDGLAVGQANMFTKLDGMK